MGALFSSPRKLETKLLVKQDELKSILISKRKLEKWHTSHTFFLKLFIILFSIQFLIFLIVSYLYKFLTIQLIQDEFIFFFIVISIFYLIRAFISYWINSAAERSLALRFELEKCFKEYTSQPGFQKIKKALKQRGEYYEIDFDQVLRLEYFSEERVINNQSFWARLSSILARNGPDYRYAIICPYCRSVNGTVSPEEKDKVEYKCMYCRSRVSFDKVIKEYSKEDDEDTLHDLEEKPEVEAKKEEDDEGDLADLK
ncbi:hypothetical protein TVAG_312440 [Trichomonas vaginalis G3]|uniref:Lunapark zinc ribbon domain-containing protein n=1 Tax=Trichomonas vaginalis (strain ATCC PRA-98 / G3) TaxID=412133 RepID=A2EHP9_TRIV3|nr:endoplasmic reticulum junction formation protein lunapark family [Trichomonas vaginalis G3]EAY07845.1 hypothetical protein TVAG_312440 [Trichomonas vaginalis G3]KAI5553457.1 endoplasmic reticulum junction formation protein lunapark family [Trichomonas vaginalis G3]|eukprot:XP_001320068.1 hypothetical protein [Trichomonas vaginalis G3]